MNEYIDIYCERVGPEFWSEPVNALTNLSFIAAAIFAFMLAQREGALRLRSSILIGLIAVIGVGSFLFHTLATGWAQLADVLPILLYQIAFLLFYARDVMRLCWHRTLALLAIFFASIYSFGSLPMDWLNGSLSYGPALIFTFGFGVWHYMKSMRENFVLLFAAFVFVISLTFRSIDMDLCAAFALGTHFMWHILNGVVLYLTARAYILNAKV